MINQRNRVSLGSGWFLKLTHPCPKDMYDPFHMVLLIKIIGKDYVVLDKAGAIQFKKPGKGKITATIEYTDQEIEEIKARAKSEGKFELVRTTDWINEDGQVVSTFQKTLYIATKEYFKSRKKLDH